MAPLCASLMGREAWSKPVESRACVEWEVACLIWASEGGRVSRGGRRERIRPLLEGERPAVSAGDCSPTLVAVLVITAIITTLGCMQGTRAEKVGLGVRWSWAHTSALPP